MGPSPTGMTTRTPNTSPSPNETWFVDSPLAFKWGSVTFTSET